MQPKPHHGTVPSSILVVEDEVLIRAFLADALREAGFSVIEAAHAEEALSYIRTAGPVDLVLSDIQMPGSLNGLQMARQLRVQFPALPIILTSGNFDPRNAEGLGRFIPKPYDVRTVVEIVSELLGAEALK
jgi:CheY-like chemotaxis protein